MGGAIAQELALARPGLVRTLTIVGSWTKSDRLLQTLVATWTATMGIEDTRAWVMSLLAYTYSAAVFEDGRVDAFCDAVLSHPYPQVCLCVCPEDGMHNEQCTVDLWRWLLLEAPFPPPNTHTSPHSRSR
jgi:hypothetical protein